MKTPQTYDVIVIGAGAAGLTAAVGCNKIGKSVLLAEKDQMGGECTNVGCVPSKALLHHAKTFYAAKQIAGETKNTKAYRNEAFTYVQHIVSDILAEETPETFEQQGIHVVKGEATFTGKCSLRVGETDYRFKRAIIATGSAPRITDIAGLPADRLLTNHNLFALSDIPEALLIVGGGPIGLEMAEAFAMLGSQVTIVERGSELARLEDSAIRAVLRERFTKLGITVYTDATVQYVEDDTTAVIKNSTGEQRVIFSKLLMAIGRVPVLPAGLHAAGISIDEKRLIIDSQFRTYNKYVYAIGDVAQSHKFTHTADDVARQVVRHIASRGWLRVNTRRAVPKVTYTEPEMAQVGMLEEAALAKFGPDRVMRIDVPYTLNDRAKTDGTTDGHLTVTVRRLTGTVLGANLIGPAAGEIVSVFSLAIDHKLSLWRLRKTIYAYPTYSLVVKKAGDRFFAQQLADLKQDIRKLIIRRAPQLIAGLFWLSLLWWFHSYRLDNGLSYEDVLFLFYDFFTSTLWGPVVYMALYAVRPLILFPATLMTALSGALFGPVWGIVYTVIGENASANFAYWIGRFFGRDLKLEDTVIGNWVEALRHNTFEAVLLMRLFYVPFDLTNYGAGIVSAKWPAYFFATLIGIMPGLTVFVLLGASIDINELKMDGLTFDALNPIFLALSISVFMVSLGLSRLLRRSRSNG